jgi:hypothetical protein
MTVADRSVQERALEALRKSGNPFRNYFARHPDDEVCARYHVPELYAREREQLLAVVDLYRYDPTTHSEVVPVLGNKGAGKTHLLHSIKHGQGNGWQILVTPGTYQKGTDFLEYVLFQIIDTLLAGGQQRGLRPIEFVGEELTRRLLRNALSALGADERLELFPAPAFARWARKLGLGMSQAEERTQWLLENLGPASGKSVRQLCGEVGLAVAKACEVLCQHVERTEAHNTAGHLRRRIYQAFARAALLGDEADLAGFLTFGFAELEYRVRPSRQDLVLALTKVLMEVFLSLKIPVVVAFDQLEDLLLVRRTDDGHKVSESFFAGIVQVMHQVDGLCLLIFAERGLWNRFVPSLDGYIQDRLNNPIHLAKYGTIKTLRLEAPPPHLVWQVVAARLRPALEELPDFAELSPVFPFTGEQVARIARTEPTLRDMLQQFGYLFEYTVYGKATQGAYEKSETIREMERESIHGEPRPTHTEIPAPTDLPPSVKSVILVEEAAPDGDIVPDTLTSTGFPVVQPVNRIDRLERPSYSVLGTEYADRIPAAPGPAALPASAPDLAALWDQELATAKTKLEPEGALTGATRELQAGLGAFLQLCHEHGVKVGAWRLQHVVPEFTFGEHPTYGVLTIAHWACKDGKPWRVGIGLFMGRGPGKPKDLQVKLTAFEGEPPIVDHLILLRPADDTVLTGKSKALWDEAASAGKHARLEPTSVDELAAVYGFPRWLAAVTESLPEGQPLPNLADFLQEHCERLLERVCLPVAG